MKYKPPLPVGNTLITITEAKKYIPWKDVRSLKARIRKDKSWGKIVPGPSGKPMGNKYMVNPKKLAEYLTELYQIEE